MTLIKNFFIVIVMVLAVITMQFLTALYKFILNLYGRLIGI